MSLPDHILLHPELYIGSTKEQTQTVFVYENGEMVKREVNFVPAFLRIFDEILINAADNKQRDPCMDSLEVWIDDEKGMITIYNSGSGIPVRKSDNGYYIPHLLFGRIFIASIIHDDNEKKIIGGRNGFGAKLTNIFSSEFRIETVDGKNKFTKVFKNNMTVEDDHLISSCSDKITKVTFKPDFQKLNMKCFEKNIAHFYYNCVLEDYFDISIFVWLGLLRNLMLTRWDVCVSSSDGQFQQFSFVNSVATIKGGTHVDYVTSQLTNHIVEIATRKNKNTHLKTHVLMSHLWVFVNARIDSPAFDFPKREKLTSEQSSFMSQGKLSKEFLKKVAKSGVVEKLLLLETFKQRLNIENLVDANQAGGDLYQKCTLILTEGDSAKALPMLGMSVINRDFYSVYPLRGKLLNVKKASKAKISRNKVIKDITEILGLKEHYRKYKNIKGLRYGRVMIMTDQDHDGTHIKGLIINLFHTFWPTLLELSPSFIVEFITRLVKATQNGTNHIELIYSNPAYDNWRKTVEDDGWSIDYKKGLGTSTYEEAYQYLAHIDTHTKEFFWGGDNDGRSIDVAFGTEDIATKKEWLEKKPNVYIGRLNPRMSYGNFINEELIFAAQAILERSIPSLIDGFRLAQRKIVYSLFKREKEASVNFETKIKVTQLASYVSEHAAHHHCERSLSRTIIRMAQTFVGSNNLNMLEPIGLFGSRAKGGKNDMDARYIDTMFSPITKLLIPKNDDDILVYMDVFGKKRHPEFLPIMPVVLVNGSQSVEIGWNTFIPSYDPRVISNNIKRLLRHQKPTPMFPWYNNFKGKIELVAPNKYMITGVYEVKENIIHIKELPVQVWTENYLRFLEKLKKRNDIEGYKNDSDNMSIDIKLFLSEEQMKLFLENKNHLGFLRLSKTIKTNNMRLLNKLNVITKYESPEHILEEFFVERLSKYHFRKNYMESTLCFERDKLESKLAIVQRVLNGEINLGPNLDAVLHEKGFRKFGETIDDQVEGYEYVAEDMMLMIRDPSKVDELKKDLDNMNKRLSYYNTSTGETLWMNELDAFDKALEGLEGFDEESSVSPIKKKTKLSNA